MRLLIFLSCISLSFSLKFLTYSPQFWPSHMNFMTKLSDALVDAGHEVVMLSEIIDASLGSAGTKKARVIEIPQSKKALEMMKLNSEGAANFWNDVPLRVAIQSWSGVFFAEQCKDQILQPELLERLRSEKFDAAFVESCHICGTVLFHLLGIDKFAITESAAILDGWFHYTQTPSNPAYVPTLMGATAGENMNFFERMYNAYAFALLDNHGVKIAQEYQDIIGEKYPQLPPIRDLMGANSLVFVNSEPLVDFPRPSSARLINIGGIAVSSKHEPLNETWSAILDLRPHTVFLSFGTFAQSYLMPEEYKRTIVEVVKRIPEVTFIWKYEKPEYNLSAGVENLIETTWAPQRDLLHDPRLSAFITHCGQGSTSESIDAAVPLIVIPVMGDQNRNAHQVIRNGFGIALHKTDLLSVEPLERAIREILGNPRYRKRAEKVRKMIKERPFAMKEIFVKNLEFLAKHGPLRQLDHYGRHLSFVQYYLIDVIGVLIAIVMLSCAILAVLCVKILAFLRKDSKRKLE